jgi:HK97 family phage portal protein
MLGGMGMLDRWNAAVKAWRLGAATVTTDTGFGNFSFGDERRGLAAHRVVELSTAVYAAVDLRSSALAAIPVRIMDNSGEHGEEVFSGSAYDLFRNVNPHWTLGRLLEAVEVSMCTYGEAFIVVEKDRAGTPIELWFANASKMKVIPHPTEYIAGYLYKAENKEIRLAPDDVVWIHGIQDPSNEFRCLSPLEAARLSVESNLDALESNRNIFRNGLNPGGIMYPADQGISLTKEQRLSIEEQLNTRLKGKDRAHRLAVFSHPMKIESPALSPSDAQFMELLNWTLSDVARAFKIPPTKLQDFSRATYSNVEQADKAFFTDCIIPEARRIAGAINEQLMPMFGGDLELVFDFSKIPALQEDQTEITDQMTKLYAMGVPLNKLLEVYRPDLLPEGGEGYPWGDEPPLAPGLFSVPPAPVEEQAPPELRVLRGKA